MTFTGASAPRVRLGMQRSAAWAMARGAFSVRACWPSAFWLVCAGLPARGAARSFGPGGRRCPESGDARRANGAGTRTTEMPAVVRSGAGLTKEQKRERVQLKNSSRVEISSWLYSPFRFVCDHVQFTWYTCSCGQIFNFFVAIKESGLRVHPDGTRTLHTLPLPPFALPCAHARGEQTPTQLTGRLERGALTQAPFVRTAGARTVRLCVWFQHDVFSSLLGCYWSTWHGPPVV